MMRRWWVFFLLYTFSFTFSLAQESNKTAFDLLSGATYNKKDTLLLGNGYRISIKDYKTPFFHPSDSSKLILDFARKSFEFRSDREQTAEWMFEDFKVLHFQRNYGSDSLLATHDLCYVLLKKKKSRVIRFSKVGQLDTIYTNNIASQIVSDGIPASIFDNRKDSISFLGKEISIKGYSSSHPRNVSTKKRLDDVYFNLTWDFYTSSSDIEQIIEADVRGIKNNPYDGIVLKDTIEPVIFRDDIISARRISSQNRHYAGSPYKANVYTRYLMNVELDDVNLFLNLHLTSDTGLIALPKFVEDNIFQLASQPEELTLISDPILVADTIFIPKKNRMPVWSYYDKNTRINGLTLGLMQLADDYNVTSNGLRLDLIGSTFGPVLGFPPAVFLFPFGWNDLYETKKHSKFMYEDIYYNRLSVTNGIKISTFGEIAGGGSVVNGLSIAGVCNENFKQNGISIVALYNYAYKTNGIQIGGGVSGSVYINGLQLSLVNFSLEQNGMQVGAYNYAKEHLSGVQLGGYNRANVINGIQIGIFNNAKLLKGFQIGLWNKNQKRSLPIFNWGN